MRCSGLRKAQCVTATNCNWVKGSGCKTNDPETQTKPKSNIQTKKANDPEIRPRPKSNIHVKKANDPEIQPRPTSNTNTTVQIKKANDKLVKKEKKQAAEINSLKALIVSVTEKSSSLQALESEIAKLQKNLDKSTDSEKQKSEEISRLDIKVKNFFNVVKALNVEIMKLQKVNKTCDENATLMATDILELQNSFNKCLKSEKELLSMYMKDFQDLQVKIQKYEHSVAEHKKEIIDLQKTNKNCVDEKILQKEEIKSLEALITEINTVKEKLIIETNKLKDSKMLQKFKRPF
jgi:chromosome segregation ATPase